MAQHPIGLLLSLFSDACMLEALVHLDMVSATAGVSVMHSCQLMDGPLLSDMHPPQLPSLLELQVRADAVLFWPRLGESDALCF